MLLFPCREMKNKRNGLLPSLRKRGAGGELTRAQINFTLKDLVKCLKYKGLLAEQEGVKDLLKVENGAVRIRQFPGRIYERITKEELDNLGIYILPEGGNPQNLKIYLTNNIGYISGEIHYEENSKEMRMGNIALYFIEYPFDKMVEHLLPLTIATTTRLVRNYYRFYY
jgi:hypothetical protein